jgi:5-(hydroxymethyl)furfural/furfural oxidase
LIVAEQVFDIVIVGAGASGCVLASRLSENPQKRVLLIEAGPDVPAGDEPADIRDPFPLLDGNPRFAWPGLVAETGADQTDGQPRLTLPYLQGHGVGGSSNINGMVADRGLPEDYDEWHKYGLIGWAWKDVLPYFNKLERDLDFSGPLHGSSGPIPVRRDAATNWTPLSNAVAKALERRGYPFIADLNADFRDGIGAVAMNCLPNRRVSAATAYLTQTVRRRPNLTILSQTFVERLDVRGGRVRGVLVRVNTGRREFHPQETIVASGALQSPALLMRSGIGPRAHLRALGIEVLRDLHGVGCNLQNHPTIGLVMHLPRSKGQSAGNPPWLQTVFRYSSKWEGCAEHDMLVIPMNKAAWHPIGLRTAGLLLEVHKSYSKGSVELASSDPNIIPRIRFNLLADSRDFERLLGGLRLGLELLGETQVRKVRNEVFLPHGAIIARLAKRTRWNWLQAGVITLLFDSERLRRKLLGNAVLDVSALAQDEEGLRRFVRLFAQPVYHPCGTCRMGLADDPEAVVDSEGRVLGISGLRVVDASIFPTIPSGSLHFPVLMTAEKIADHMKAEWQRKAEVRFAMVG